MLLRHVDQGQARRPARLSPGKAQPMLRSRRLGCRGGLATLQNVLEIGLPRAFRRRRAFSASSGHAAQQARFQKCRLHRGDTNHPPPGLQQEARSSGPGRPPRPGLAAPAASSFPDSRGRLSRPRAAGRQAVHPPSKRQASRPWHPRHFGWRRPIWFEMRSTSSIMPFPPRRE